MTNRYPLILDSINNKIKELPVGDNLDLAGAGISSTSSITASSITVTGLSTFTGNVDINSDVDINRSLAVTGGATISGFSTFTKFVDINESVDIAGGLNVAGISTFVGACTFKGGTVTLGDADSDNVVFTSDVNSNIIPNTDGAYDLGSSNQQWRDVFINGTADTDALVVSGISTFSSNVDINSDVDINRSLAVTGGATVS